MTEARRERDEEAGPGMRIRQQSLVWRTVDEEGIVLDLESSSYLRTNPTGAELWELLVEDRSEDELVAHLVACYDVGRDQAAADVRAFLAMLRAHGVLEE
ncbi:MAG: PqqD family protein [Actinomycetota bacterium]|nr:PqqD family protein [Actinomycetota bacterium]